MTICPSQNRPARPPHWIYFDKWYKQSFLSGLSWSADYCGACFILQPSVSILFLIVLSVYQSVSIAICFVVIVGLVGVEWRRQGDDGDDNDNNIGNWKEENQNKHYISFLRFCLKN